MLSISKESNLNYLAKIVRISNLRPHNNAHSIQCTSIDGFNVIVGADQEIGNLGIFFPLEVQISSEFLSANSLFKDKSANADPEKFGFFENNGRVKALKLRGEKSEGFWVPIDHLDFLNLDFDIQAFENKEFDTIGSLLLAKKYRCPSRTQGEPNQKKIGKTPPKESALLENQFHFHIDTDQLPRNIWKFKSDTNISITQKLHGTSFISSKVLVKRSLSNLERLVKKLGVLVQETYYDNLYASRRVVKNLKYLAIPFFTMVLYFFSQLWAEKTRLVYFYKSGIKRYFTQFKPNKGSFYDEDIWGLVNGIIKPHLKDGMSVYGEIVGYLPNGKPIQKGYDYGCSVGKYRIFIYRITWTIPSGYIIEWSWRQIKEWCLQHGLDCVPEFYQGPVSNLFDQKLDSRSRDDQDKLLDTLSHLYLEHDASVPPLAHRKTAILCKNKVPDEGIVVRNDDNYANFDVYKFKSFKFREFESKQLDSGEIDVESEESTEEAS